MAIQLFGNGSNQLVAILFTSEFLVYQATQFHGAIYHNCCVTMTEDDVIEILIFNDHTPHP
jgi:hypothetical protein